MRRFVFAAFALTVFVACQPPTTELTDERRAEIAAEVELLHGQFWDAWRETDVDRGMSFYLNSPDFMFAFEAGLTKGWAALNDMVQAGDVASQTITFAESHTTVLASDVVHVVERGTYRETNLEGETGPVIPCTVSVVWVNRDGEWKAQFAHVAETIPESP